jgi:hypothetical protein
VTASVPATAERDGQLALLRRFGCPQSLVRLLLQLAPGTTWAAHQAGGEGAFYIVAADANAEG